MECPRLTGSGSLRGSSPPAFQPPPTGGKKKEKTPQKTRLAIVRAVEKRHGQRSEPWRGGAEAGGEGVEVAERGRGWMRSHAARTLNYLESDGEFKDPAAESPRQSSAFKVKSLFNDERRRQPPPAPSQKKKKKIKNRLYTIFSPSAHQKKSGTAIFSISEPPAAPLGLLRLSPLAPPCRPVLRR